MGWIIHAPGDSVYRQCQYKAKTKDTVPYHSINNASKSHLFLPKELFFWQKNAVQFFFKCDADFLLKSILLGFVILYFSTC